MFNNEIEKVLPKFIVNKIKENNYLEKVIDNTYLSDENNPNFEEIKNNHFKRDKRVAEILNSGSGIGNIFFDWVRSYFGNIDGLYNINENKLLKNYLVTGSIAFKINFGEVRLEAIDSDAYFVVGDTEYFIKPFSEFRDGLEYKFLLIEEFNNKILKRSLFEVASFDLEMGEKVSLDSSEITKGFADVQRIELDSLILSIKIDNGKIRQLLPKIYGIDRKVLLNEHTMGNYGESWVILKGIDLERPEYFDNPETDEEGRILHPETFNINKVGRLLTTYTQDENGNIVNNAGAGVEIVGNDYGNIEISLKMIEKDYQSISSITHIPMWAFLSDANSGIESGKAKERGMDIFYKDIEKLQKAVETIFNNFWDTVGVAEKYRVLEFAKIVETSESDKEILIKSKLENIKMKVELGLITKLEAIMELYGISEDEAKIRLTEYEKEQEQLLLTQKENDNATKDNKQEG